MIPSNNDGSIWDLENTSVRFQATSAAENPVRLSVCRGYCAPTRDEGQVSQMGNSPRSFEDHEFYYRRPSPASRYFRITLVYSERLRQLSAEIVGSGAVAKGVPSKHFLQWFLWYPASQGCVRAAVDLWWMCHLSLV